MSEEYENLVADRDRLQVKVEKLQAKLDKIKSAGEEQEVTE
jgi:hypothetical protein